MKLPRRIGPLPTNLLIAGAALVALAVVAIVLATGGGSNGTEQPSSGGSDVGPISSPTAEASAPMPEPSATAVAIRTDCNAIRGTEFQSDEERTWFDQNCLPQPPRATAGTQAPIGDRLIIPGASVNTEVYSAAVPASGIMPDPAGYFNAVWYDFSSHTGLGGYANGGNIVLSGHVDCARCYNGGSGTAVFWSIRNLKVGDTAQYKLQDGTTLTYVVTASQSYSPNADWGTIVSSSTADMTLITCTGTFSGGEYTLRHVVSLKKTDKPL